MLQPVNQPENLQVVIKPDLKDINWDGAADFGDVHGALVVPVTEGQLVESQNLINDNQDLDSRIINLLCREYLPNV